MVATTQDTGSTAALFASMNAKSASTTTDATAAAGIQDRFLKMLVTQLQNQDPLNPMDNAAITSQMAQLSTVTGIDKLNATLLALSNSMALGQTVSATGMIGHGVLVAGSGLELSSSQAVGGMELTQPVDSVIVNIKDKSGNVVNTLKFGAQEAGILPFTWNGETTTGATAADGSYTFSVEAMSGDSTLYPDSLAFGLVNAVTPNAAGATLELGGLGSFALSAVKQVL